MSHPLALHYVGWFTIICSKISIQYETVKTYILWGTCILWGKQGNYEKNLCMTLIQFNMRFILDLEHGVKRPIVAVVLDGPGL